MKRLLFILALLGVCLSARATTNVVATITFTNVINGVTNGGTITVNGDQRNYTNGTLASAAIWIQSTNIVGHAATNTLFQLSAYPVTGVARMDFLSTNAFTITSDIETALTVTLSAGIGTVTYVTNNFGQLFPAMFPIESHLTAQGRTNQANRLINAMNTDYPTSKVAQSSVAMSNFVSLNLSQIVSNKTIYASVLDGARGTNMVALHGTNYWLRGGTIASASFSNMAVISSGGMGTNWIMVDLIMTNGANYGLAFRSPGTGANSDQFGSGATATAENAFAAGTLAVASGVHSFAGGNGAEATGGASTAVGTGAGATATNATANGAAAEANAPGSSAFGAFVVVAAGHTNSMGLGASTDETNQIMVGASTHKVRIPGLIQPTGVITNMTVDGTNKVDGSWAWTRYDLSTLANGVNVGVPMGTNKFIRLSGTLSDVASIVGIVGGAPSGGQNGQELNVLNDTGYTVTFAVSTSDPTAANRLSGSDVSVQHGGWADIFYDMNATRWRVKGVYPSTVLTTNLALASGSLATNTASFNLATNDFVMNTYYTNTQQRAWVGCAISMTNILAGDVCNVRLFLDQDADGTWEMQGRQVRLNGVALLAGVQELSGWLQPGARFLFTNFTTGGTSAIQANSSQLVKQ